MHITLEADYAVRIVNCLAKNNVRMDAKTLSAQTGVTLRFSLKILRKLVAQGIVRSFKGTQGGYELARPADQITLGEVITFSRCVDNEEFVCTCGDSADCRFNKAYKELSQMVREKLYSITFAQ